MSEKAAPHAKRGHYAPSMKRREKILDTVMEIIDTEGYEAVRTSLVAERSGIPESTVLYHFPTKDHLLVAAMEHADDLSLSSALKGMSIDDTRTGLEMDRTTFRNWGVDETQASRNRQRLLTALRGPAADPDNIAHDFILKHTQRGIKTFAALIRHRQENGLAHPSIDPDEVGAQIFALLEGLNEFGQLGIEVPVGDLLTDAIRRLSGENWMETAKKLSDGTIGTI